VTPKEQNFAHEYLVDLNASKAAIRAGYSQKTAYAIANKLLRKAEVAAYIQEAMDKRAKRVDINKDDVLKEISKLAFSDIRKIFDENGNLLPPHMLPDEVAATISSIDVVTTRIPGKDAVEVEYTSKIRFWDKRASLELLGKHLKLFTDKHEHTGANGAPIQIIASQADENL